MPKKRKKKQTRYSTKRLPKLEDMVYVNKQIVPLGAISITLEDPYPAFEIPAINRRGRLLRKFRGSAYVEYEEEEDYVYTYKDKVQTKTRLVKNRYHISLTTAVKHLRPAKKRGRKHAKASD
jgi:hypothetical protein